MLMMLNQGRPGRGAIARRATATVIVTAVLAGLAMGMSAQAAPPPVRTQGGIEFMSGGIGSDESQFMLRVAPQWAVTMEFAMRDPANPKGADFVADVQVEVRDASGHTVLQTTAAGPYLLARLAPGHYEARASLQGQTLQRAFDVRTGKPVRVEFTWPARAATPSS